MKKKVYELAVMDDATKEQKKKNLIKYIKTARNAKGLTGVQLSLKSNLSRNYIAMLESGKLGMPKIENLFAIAEALEIPHYELLIKAGYRQKINIKYEKLNFERMLTLEADNLGLSTELTKALVNVFNVILHSQQKEAICRDWFKKVMLNYFSEKIHKEGTTQEKIVYYSNLIQELIDYENQQEFKIEEIEI